MRDYKQDFEKVARYLGAVHVYDYGEHVGTADEVIAQIKKHELKIAELANFRSSVDCRHAGAYYAELSGSHCDSAKPCLRCSLERKVGEVKNILDSLEDLL